MVGVGIPSAPTGAASATATKNTSGGKTEGHGRGHGDDFFDVLSKAAGGDTDGQLDGETSSLLAGDGTQSGRGAAAAGHHSSAKAVLDLQKTSLKGQSGENDGEATVAEPQVATAWKQKASVTATAATVQATKGQKHGAKSTDATDDAPDGDAVKDAKHADKSSKDATSDADGDSKAAPSHSEGAASDALSLLHSQSPEAALSAQVGMPAAQRTSGDHSSKDDGRVTATTQAHSTSSGDASETSSESDAADPSAKAFKLVRADGRGQSLEMSIGKGRDHASDVDVKAGGAGGGDAVTVLDSRRYLGLASNTNSSAVIGAMSGDSEWSSAMQPSSALSNEASWTSTGKVVNTLKIQMNPEDLGLVTATMRLSGDDLTVDLKVQSGEAYRQLHNDQGAMMDALRAQGYSVDKITVTLAAPPQTDANTQSGFQGQSQQQQSFQNQAQGGGQSRGQNFSGQQANGNEGGWSRSDVGAEDGASGGNQRSGSGGVYL